MHVEPTPQKPITGKILEWLGNLTESVTDILLSPEYLVPVIAAAFFAWLARTYVKRPKITVSGKGSAPAKLENGDAHEVLYFTIANHTSFLGRPIERPPLSFATARIYDPRTKTTGRTLRWNLEGKKIERQKDIPIGEQANLFLFGINNGRLTEFHGNTLRDVEGRPTLLEPNQRQRFEIVFHDKIGRKYRLPIEVETFGKPQKPAGMSAIVRKKFTLPVRSYLLHESKCAFLNLQFREGMRALQKALAWRSF